MNRYSVGSSLCAALMAMCHGVAASAQCTGDINGDFSVDGKDISYVLSAWGPCGADACSADLTGDGQVNGLDLAALLASWGYCPVVVPSWATLIDSYPDPAVVTNPALRDAIVATGHAWRVRHTQTQIEMVLIPSGTFVMGCVSGSPGCDQDAAWPHEVELTDSFYLSRCEVTQGQWTAVMGSNPSFHQGPDYPDAENRPVEQVSWLDVQGFLAATGLRLTTEAEWEMACRAGTRRRLHGFPGMPDGTDDFALLDLIAWHPGNSGGQTHPVGQLLPNGYGLFDTLGNVREWCSDDFQRGYYWWSPRVNPPGADIGFLPSTKRVNRGGGHLGGAASVFIRLSIDQPYQRPELGFRVARSVERATLLGVSPASGSPAGGTLLTLTGTNMGGVKSVSVGGVAATEVTVVDATRVTARTPQGAGGAYEVSLDGASGSASIPGAFTYASASVPSWAELLEPLPDPAVVTRQSLRDAITATGLAWRVRDSATGIEMVLIPPGSFTMGCTPLVSGGCLNEALPAHPVTLTSPFYMSRYEVTQAQWLGVMGYNPSPCGSEFTGSCPVTERPPASVQPVFLVNWYEAAEFCRRAGMRLPTEAQWEYSYRAGTTTRFHGFPLAPDGFDTTHAIYSPYSAIAWTAWNLPENRDVIPPVGLRAGNGFGLHDMATSVYEWVGDWAGPYSADPQVDPLGPDSGTKKVVRGSYVRSADWFTHSASIRYFVLPDADEFATGLRPVRDP